MRHRRLLFADKVIIAICCFWLIGWIGLGAAFAIEVFQRQDLLLQAWRKAAAVLAGFSLIGCIALIGLWPHRNLLRRTNVIQENAFLVKTNKDEDR
jgi:hypothetical protein